MSREIIHERAGDDATLADALEAAGEAADGLQAAALEMAEEEYFARLRGALFHIERALRLTKRALRSKGCQFQGCRERAAFVHSAPGFEVRLCVGHSATSALERVRAV